MGIISKPTAADVKVRRHLLFLGTCPGLPESPLHAEARAAHSVLNAIVTLAHESSANTPAGPPAGAFHGLDLLHLASTPKPVTTPRTSISDSSSTEALRNANVNLGHALSLDHCFNSIGRHDEGLVSLVKVASTKHHTVLLLSTGVLVLCSQDPAEHATVVTFPQQAVREFSILDVAAGDEHFVAVTDHGGVFTWGTDNTYGQLGDGTVWKAPHTRAGSSRTLTAGTPVLTDPKEIPGFGLAIGRRDAQPCIIQVACGHHHTVLLAASRTCVYTFGRGQCGQLGQSPATPFVPVPKSIKSVFGVPFASVEAAGDHTLLLTQSGSLLAYGSNMTGAVGTGFVSKNVSPAQSILLAEDDEPPRADECRPIYEPPSCTLRGRKANEDPLFFPRRVLRCTANTTTNGLPPIARVASSASHTVAVVETEDADVAHLYSSGLRELPVTSSPGRFRDDLIGSLGRSTVGEKNGSLVFRRAAVVPRPSSSQHGGWLVQTGLRFSALLDPSKGQLFILGNVIDDNGSVLVGTSEAAQKCQAGSTNVALAPLDVGGSGRRRVVAACPARGGLFVLVEDKLHE